MKKEIIRTVELDRNDIFFTDLDSVIFYLTELNSRYNKASLDYDVDEENLNVTLDYLDLETDKEYEERLQTSEQNKKVSDLMRLNSLQKEIDLIKQKYGL